MRESLRITSFAAAAYEPKSVNRQSPVSTSNAERNIQHDVLDYRRPGDHQIRFCSCFRLLGRKCNDSHRPRSLKLKAHQFRIILKHCHTAVSHHTAFESLSTIGLSKHISLANLFVSLINRQSINTPPFTHHPIPQLSRPSFTQPHIPPTTKPPHKMSHRSRYHVSDAELHSDANKLRIIGHKLREEPFRGLEIPGQELLRIAEAIDPWPRGRSWEGEGSDEESERGEYYPPPPPPPVRRPGRAGGYLIGVHGDGRVHIGMR